MLPLLVMNSNEPINMRTKTNRGLNQIKSLRFVVFVEYVMLIINPDSGTM